MPKQIKFYILLICFFLLQEILIAGQWKSIVPMSTPRAGAAAAVWGGKIYVFGGKSSDNRVLNTVEYYDLSTKQWNNWQVPDFNHERYNAAAVVFQNKIYLIGGRGHKEVTKMVEVYDPVQNVWSVVHALHEKREGFSAVVLNNHIYVLGGQEEESSMVDEMEWFDETQNKWYKVDEEMPFKRVASFSAAVGDTVYLFGGYYYGLTKTLYKGWFNAQGSHWLQGADMPQARAYGTTVQLGDSLFLIGGEAASGKTDRVEIYNLLSGEISDGPLLPAPRSGMAGGRVGDSIFVLGGYAPYKDEPLATAEVFIDKLTGIKEVPAVIPRAPLIIKGYPNPFNGQIVLQVSSAKTGLYQLDIYNIHGQHVKNIFSGRLSAGIHDFRWQARETSGNTVPSGVYFLRINSQQQMTSYKMVYVK